ncbi:MAG TPA: glycosyltransferase [Bryobacteraceae bacterium]|nr:glycosyltransferase [Bryobacteraceae bacterium]
MKVSVIVPVIDETVSLRKTIEVVLAQNREHVSEILIIVCKKTTPEALRTCDELVREHPDLIQIRYQQRPFLGGAMRDAFEWASGSHVLMMSSDLETDPETAKELIAVAQDGYDIVTATRWKGNGAFHGYNPVKHVANLIFQKTVGLLYGTSLSDLTFGYRLFKTEWVKRIAWEELRHAFMLETIVKPLRLGARVTEIPTVWRARPEGVSHNQFSNHLAYFRIGLRTLFQKPENLLARTPSMPTSPVTTA